MARTKQTARRSTGGRAPRHIMASPGRLAFKASVTSSQAAVYTPSGKAVQSSYINYENMFTSYDLTPPAAATDASFATHTSTLVTEDKDGQLSAYVGVNVISKYDRAGMATHGRPHVDLVVALDISGSMASRFSGEEAASKLKGAKDCLLAMLTTLKPEDTLGIVVFNTSQHALLEPRRWADVDKSKLKKDIARLTPNRGTDLSGALVAATAMLNAAPEADSASRTRTRRIIFMTDLRSSGNSVADEQQVMTIVRDNSASAVYTTVVGVGIDLNKVMVEQISSVCGCRYMSAVRADELSSLMSTDFDYDVTIIAREIELTFELPAGTGPIVQGYGSPEVNHLQAQPACTVTISSEFPASSLKGGMYVFRVAGNVFDHMKRTGTGIDGRLLVQHLDDDGIARTSASPLHIPASPGCSLPELRKAVALARYVDLQNDFLASVSDRDEPLAEDSARDTIDGLLSFRQDFVAEMAACGDHTLATVNQGDLQLLDKMIQVTAEDASLPAPPLPTLPAAPAQTGPPAQVKSEPLSMTARQQKKAVAHQARLLQQAGLPSSGGGAVTVKVEQPTRRRSKRQAKMRA